MQPTTIPTINIKLTYDRIVTMEPLPVEIAEAIAADYKPEELRGPLMARFSRDLIAAGITKIDGKIIDHQSFNPRKQFKSMHDWSRLSKGYDLINHTKSLQQLVEDTEIPELLTLPSGNIITLSLPTIDMVEKAELVNLKQTNFLIIRHNMAAAAVTHLNGNQVTDQTNLRLELPDFHDWNHLCAAFDKINLQLQEDEDTSFLFSDSAPEPKNSGEKSPTQPDTEGSP